MKTDEEYLIYAMRLTDKIASTITDFEMRNFSKINVLSELVAKKLREEQAKLPYHINIIDIIGANENAHSRILEHLLKQYTNGKFEILENLLKYIIATNQCFNLNVNTPRIKAEKERIDILIKDKEYAIIFENKIHNAIDQEAQLSRYIEKVNEMGYRKEQIYILYLPRDDGKSPNDDSWGKYKEMFKDRYMRLTYRNHILPWLRDFLLPNIRIRDIYLKSCIEQYIDHLEGLFSLRNIQVNMNKELKKQISEVLNLSTSSEKNHSILLEKMKEVDHVRDQLAIIQSEIEKECWQEWLKRFDADFNGLKLINGLDNSRNPNVGVEFSWNGIIFRVKIQKDVKNNTIYYGIGRHFEGENIAGDLQETINHLLEDFKSSTWWHGCKYTSFEDAYSSVSCLIKRMEEFRIKQL